MPGCVQTQPVYIQLSEQQLSAGGRNGSIMWYYSMTSSSLQACMTIFSMLLAFLQTLKLQTSAICHLYSLCDTSLVKLQLYITVQCRSALLAHARPTMFYIPQLNHMTIQPRTQAHSKYRMGLGTRLMTIGSSPGLKRSRHLVQMQSIMGRA